MAFKIVRNDITKVEADIIVNTANPKPKCVSGTDLAIYEAAGKETLLAERKTIGPIERGEIAVTGAYNLNAKYIIHTVGPIVYDSLTAKLENDLKSCYKSILKCAVENNIRSIAICCISTGEFHFPNRRAAEIAISTVKEFLKVNEDKFDRIIFNVFKDIDYEIYKQLLN